MTSKHIVAYTPAVPTPPFINISFVDENTVRVSIRGEAKDNPNGYYGLQTTIDLPRDIAIGLFAEAAEKVRYEQD